MAPASGEYQAATLGLRNGIAKFICGVDPEANRIECVAESGFLRGTMGRATRKLRHLGDERLVFFAPVDDDFVLDHSSSPSLAFKIAARTCLTWQGSSDAVLITTVYLRRRCLRATMETHAHSLRLPSQLLEARGDGAGAGGHQPDLLAARPVDLPLH